MKPDIKYHRRSRQSTIWTAASQAGKHHEGTWQGKGWAAIAAPTVYRSCVDGPHFGLPGGL